MNGKFPEEMKCPVCLGIPQKEIFQCKNGHTVCDECSKNLKICPQCRVVFEDPKIRSRALENLLDLMKFDCKFKPQGCNDQLTRKEYYNHVEKCHFGGFLIKLCEHFGYPCDFQASSKTVPRTLDHFAKVHEIPRISKTNSVTVEVASWSTLKKMDGFWRPVIWEKKSIADLKLVVIFLHNKKDNLASMLPIQLNEPSSETESIRIHFSIDPVNPSKADAIWWCVPIVKIQCALDRINRPFFQVPVDILEKEYIKDDKLFLNCWMAKYISPKTSKTKWAKAVLTPIEKKMMEHIAPAKGFYRSFNSSGSATLAATRADASSSGSSPQTAHSKRSTITSSQPEATTSNNQIRQQNVTSGGSTPSLYLVDNLPSTIKLQLHSSHLFGNPFTSNANINVTRAAPIVHHTMSTDGEYIRVGVSSTSSTNKRGNDGKSGDSDSPQQKQGRSDDSSSE